MPTEQEETNESGSKASVEHAGPAGTKAKLVLAIGTVISGITAVSPGVLALMGKVPLKQLQQSQSGAWEGGLLFIPPDLLQAFTVLICVTLLGFTFVRSDWLNEKWGITRVFIASLLVVVLSFGIFSGLYYVLAEPELASMARIEAQKAESPDRGATPRLSIPERIKDKGGSLLRDLAIGWFYLWFFVGLSQAPMLLALIQYYAQLKPKKRRVPRVVR